MKKVIILLLSLAVVFSLAACSNTPQGAGRPDEPANIDGAVKIAGSATMLPLNQAWASAFTAANNGATADAVGDNSASAVAAVKDGSATVGALSRSLSADELAAGLVEYTVAYDAIAVVVNSSNGVKDLTVEQIYKIFSGEITNWQDVGGEDGEIVLIGYENNSGTRVHFENVLGILEGAGYKTEAKSPNELVSAVSSNPQAIGYVSMGFVDNKVKTLDVEGITISEETLKSGEYIFSRNLMMVISRDADPTTRAFIQFVIGPEGQAVVDELGYLRIS